jgi:hypothetical protein
MGIHKKDNKDKYSNFIYPILFILKKEIYKWNNWEKMKKK